MSPSTPQQPIHPPPPPAGSAAGAGLAATDLADHVAAAVLAIPGVVDMHGGMFGEVATYLPGRRVLGVQIRDRECQVHVALRSSADIRGTADVIRTIVRPMVGRPVHVTIQDLVDEGRAR